MIAYVDTSTLIKLVINETGTQRATQIWQAADSLVTVSITEVEARAALATAARSKRLAATEHRRAKTVLRGLLEQIDIVDVTAELVATASDLTELDALRGYDAVHLAAALLVDADVLTSADAELCNGAARHGIRVANPLDET